MAYRCNKCGKMMSCGCQAIKYDGLIWCKDCFAKHIKSTNVQQNNSPFIIRQINNIPKK